jgi:hypothetical protein
VRADVEEHRVGLAAAQLLGAVLDVLGRSMAVVALVNLAGISLLYAVAWARTRLGQGKAVVRADAEPSAGRLNSPA